MRKLTTVLAGLTLSVAPVISNVAFTSTHGMQAGALAEGHAARKISGNTSDLANYAPYMTQLGDRLDKVVLGDGNWDLIALQIIVNDGFNALNPPIPLASQPIPAQDGQAAQASDEIFFYTDQDGQHTVGLDDTAAAAGMLYFEIKADADDTNYWDGGVPTSTGILPFTVTKNLEASWQASSSSGAAAESAKVGSPFAFDPSNGNIYSGYGSNGVFRGYLFTNGLASGNTTQLSSNADSVWSTLYSWQGNEGTVSYVNPASHDVLIAGENGTDIINGGGLGADSPTDPGFGMVPQPGVKANFPIGYFGTQTNTWVVLSGSIYVNNSNASDDSWSNFVPLNGLVRQNGQPLLTSGLEYSHVILDSNTGRVYFALSDGTLYSASYSDMLSEVNDHYDNGSVSIVCKKLAVNVATSGDFKTFVVDALAVNPTNGEVYATYHADSASGQGTYYGVMAAPVNDVDNFQGLYQEVSTDDSGHFGNLISNIAFDKAGNVFLTARDRNYAVNVWSFYPDNGNEDQVVSAWSSGVPTSAAIQFTYDTYNGGFFLEYSDPSLGYNAVVLV